MVPRTEGHAISSLGRRAALVPAIRMLGQPAGTTAVGLCTLILLRLGGQPAPAFLPARPAGPRAPVAAPLAAGEAPQVMPATGSDGLTAHAAGSRAASIVAASVFAVAGGAAAGRRRRSRANNRTSREAADGEAPARIPDKPSGEGQSKGRIERFLNKLNTSPELQEDLKTFFSSLTVALAIRAVLVEPRFIPSLSMYPTFDVGDQLTVDKISKRWRDYERRDVVVFNPPPAFFDVVGGDRNGEALIKRIVALEGDVVEMKSGGVLYINGEPQDEPFTNERARYTYGPVTVPPGCVFVLGDNRNASLDGHVWGFLPKENIIGRATLKFWPPWHVGGVTAAPP